MQHISSTTPILEFDPDRNAIVNPRTRWKGDIRPSRAVLCFFQDVIQKELASGHLRRIGELISEIGTNPIYRTIWQGQEMAVVHPGVGASLAAGFLEELIGMGIKQFVVCGGCGVLDEDIAAGHVVVLNSAVRDEGTSYHYLPSSREVASSMLVTQTLEEVLQNKNIPYRKGKTWTTDAIYRETPARRQNRLQDGCIVVEMEAAALFAVAQYRGVEIGQVVYGGDLVMPGNWDYRDWNGRASDRQLLFQVAVETCACLEPLDDSNRADPAT